MPTLAQTVKVGILLNQREVKFKGNAPVQVYKNNRKIRTVPADESFRIWMGNGTSTEPGWLVQVGAFQKSDSVDNCKSMLARLTDLTPVVDRKGKLYLVRFGPFTSLSDATSLKDLLRLNGFPDVYLVATDGNGHRKHKLHLVTRDYDKHPLSDHAITLKSRKPVSVDGQPYRGDLEVRIHGNRFNVINVVDLETYLRGVVPAELSGTLFPQLEALKAQAVAARTYVFYNRGQFRSMGFDICATQSCQVYKGVSVEQELTDQAIEETAGEILTHKGKPINALFTAICGGHTEDVEYVFSGDPVPYLRGVPCEGGDQPWNEVRFAANWLSPIIASPYYRRIYLGLARLMTLELVRPDQLAQLNLPATPESVTNVLEPVLIHLGLPSPDGTPLWSNNLREIGTRLAGHLFDSKDPDELVHAELLVQPLKNQTATLADIVAISAAMLERFDGPVVDLLRYKVVDDTFIADPPTPGTLFLNAGAGELPMETARLRAGDRCRMLQVDGKTAAIIVIAPESQEDLLDSFVSEYRWYRYLDIATLSEKIRRYINVGRIKKIEIEETTKTGRITAIRVTGSSKTGVIRGLKVRWALGGKEMKFKLVQRLDPNGKLLGIYLVGTAWGHGVGLCQVGAYGMASRGADYRTILTHYYTGVDIERIDTKTLDSADK